MNLSTTSDFIRKVRMTKITVNLYRRKTWPMFLISSLLLIPSIRHRNMILELSKIDHRIRMTEITEEEVTSDRTAITEMVLLLFLSQARQKTRLKWRISEIKSRNFTIPRCREHLDSFLSSTRTLIGSKGIEINQLTKMMIRKKKRDNSCLLMTAS